MTGQRTYRYYDFVMAAFVTVLLCSNFIGAAKQATVSLPLVASVTRGRVSSAWHPIPTACPW